MALNLSKGKPALNLTTSLPNVEKYTVGLAWNEAGDLDASVIIRKEGSRTGVVYYAEKLAAGIQHNGDALDGFADGDDETIDIDLSKVDGDELIIGISSYNSGTFGAANNPVARLYKEGETSPVLEVALDSEAAFSTAVAIARIFKEGTEWKVENLSKTVGDSANGLLDLAEHYA